MRGGQVPLVRLPVSAPLQDRRRGAPGVRIGSARVTRRLTRWRGSSETGPRPVTGLRAGECGIVVRIAAAAPDRLVKLSGLGVMPGVRVTLVQRNPAVVLRIAETSIALDGE